MKSMKLGAYYTCSRIEAIYTKDKCLKSTCPNAGENETTWHVFKKKIIAQKYFFFNSGMSYYTSKIIK